MLVWGGALQQGLEKRLQVVWLCSDLYDLPTCLHVCVGGGCVVMVCLCV